MACSNLTTGRGSVGCKIIGGVEKVYLANSDMITAVGTTGANETEVIIQSRHQVLPFTSSPKYKKRLHSRLRQQRMFRMDHFSTRIY